MDVNYRSPVFAQEGSAVQTTLIFLLILYNIKVVVVCVLFWLLCSSQIPLRPQGGDSQNAPVYNIYHNYDILEL